MGLDNIKKTSRYATMNEPGSSVFSVASVPNERQRLVIPGRLTRGQSCLTCYQRKVKCDGKRPCTTCVKSSRAADCRSTRTASGLRLLEAHEQALLQRLRRYEQLLISHGIPLNDQEDGTGENDPDYENPSETVEESGGHVIAQGGHPRFVNKLVRSSLWSHFAQRS